MDVPIVHPVEMVPLASLTPHPRNYRGHPPEQLVHLVQSFRDNGQYKNIVTARDLTILGGHGVAIAAEQAGLTDVSVVRLPIDADSPAALKIVAGDNETPLLADDDDRALSQMLKDILDSDVTAGLLGTGYDEQMLANLLFVTRPASEIATRDEAAQWVGLPGYDNIDPAHKLVISFESEAERDQFVADKDLTVSYKKPGSRTWSTWWPPKERDDQGSVAFTADA